MNRHLRLAACAPALFLAACSQDGGGPLGIELFNRNQHVAAAEPLFGRREDRCLENPSFLMSIFAQRQQQTGTDQTGNETPGATLVGDSLQATCNRLRGSISAVLMASFTPAAPGGTPSPAAYDQRARNEVMDALVASSNRRCGRYMAFLQTYDANINTSFGVLSIIAGGLSPIVRGDDTARTLGGISAMLTGTRGTFNEAHFRNRTIAVLASAFENARRQQRRDMVNLQQCPVDQYTLMRGMEDAFRYHSTCSVVAGLEEAAKAVERAHSPDIATMRRQMQELAELRTQMRAVTGPDAGTTETTATATAGAPNGNGAPQTPIPGETVVEQRTTNEGDRQRTETITTSTPSEAPACPFTARTTRTTRDVPRNGTGADRRRP